jgi:hypothetical protein
MLAGEMEKIDREIGRLTERRASLALTHGELAKVAAFATVPNLADLVPAVRAHHPYGGRGNLRNFLRKTLRAAYPHALDSRTIGELAVWHFWGTFESDIEREHFRSERVTHTLRKLVDRGEVERMHRKATASVGGWRWKVDAPSIAELQLVAKLPATAEREAEPWR